ncbi:MAG: hypothetical protein UX20_C0037G0002 [Candidatus Magasanikbacteria bacterium GW2011_GWC2_45_8]|uniref:DUF304 domain-containing protein n=2 Tax=Candidatus Magasanikiibacteriota TaxID=1752731 RepID=A0A0G1Q5A5_9BACT|nr:MAG: hypothetical protein UX20_C0037G0002 [Candidatus Magasanikbacteria bacterium GW2011_GWC2_45_8]
MNYSTIIRQKSYEHIIYVLRQSPWMLAPRVIVLIILMAVGYGVFFLLKLVTPDVFFHPLWGVLLLLLGSIYALTVWLFFYTSLINYFLDLWIITNDRIVSIDQRGLFSRTMSELDLYRIQDVTSESHGLFATIFYYGKLTAQTAAAKDFFIFDNVQNPHHMREEIIRLADEDRKYHAQAAQM